jgi:hypothetical protein
MRETQNEAGPQEAAREMFSNGEGGILFSVNPNSSRFKGLRAQPAEMLSFPAFHPLPTVFTPTHP